ncbi:MAG: hypothetical protein ACP5IJ_00990 [Candidatus Nanoarchaeia archaeon]
MFNKNSGNYQVGVKLAGITWMLATLIPIIGILRRKRRWLCELKISNEILMLSHSHNND